MSPAVVWAETQGEVRLYDTAAGEFQTLNPTAAAIWRRVVEHGERDRVLAALAEEYGAQDDNQRRLIASDTDRFVAELAGLGLLVEQPYDDGTEGAVVEGAVVGGATAGRGRPD